MRPSGTTHDRAGRIPAVCRRLFNTLTLLSLALSAAVAVVWPVSYSRAFGLAQQQWTRDGHPVASWSAEFDRGRLMLQYERFDDPANVGVDWRWKGIARRPAGRRWSYPDRSDDRRRWVLLGVERVRASVRMSSGLFWTGRLTAIPLSYVTAAFALPPAAWLLTWSRRRRMRNPTACRRCGYDL